MDIKSLLSPPDTSPNPRPAPAPVHDGHPASNPQTAPSSRSVQPPRQTSSSMETLADLASMQQYQAAVRHSSTALRNADLQTPVHSPTVSSNPYYTGSGSYPPTPTRARSGSLLTRHPDVPPRPPTLATPLSEADLPIMEQPMLLDEQEWAEQLQAAMFLASDINDRIGVMEQCAKAVTEIPYSPKLWTFYGDWMWIMYKRSHGIEDVYQLCALEQLEINGDTLAEQPWTEEDISAGQELIQWDLVMNPWRQGADATQWHMDSSHTVWDPFMELTLYDLSTSPTPEKTQQAYQSFQERLKHPHLTWEHTYSMFSNFVSHYYQENYTDIMADAKKKGQVYQAAYDMRQKYEFGLRRATQNGEEAEEKSALRNYLDWEEQQHRQKAIKPWGRNLYIALCHRAVLRFPKDPDYWLDLITFFMEPEEDKNALLENADRATRHCPGSGELWAQRLSALEACGRPYKEIENVKHSATSTGQLEDNDNMTELIKVETAWCSYLRRKAFSTSAGADSVDVAEVAIRSAIENVARVGRDKYGHSFRGDPEFRVERIYLKFLAQAGQHDQARELFCRLESTHGDSHFFWERWYLWEMATWEASQDRSVESQSQSVPTGATAALKRAMRRPDVDWPEKIVEMYLHHCAQHETAQQLIEAQVEGRRATKKIKRLRDQQAAHVAQQDVAYQEQLGVSEQTTESKTGKRSHDDADAEASDAKRQRRKSSGKPNDQSGPSDLEAKRDRENTTVVVRHLPHDVDELSIRKYFRDCGEIVAVAILPDEDNLEAAATIEFKSAEDILAAQTKSMKTFNDKAIDVQIGTGTLLWVTNYPANAGEAYLKNLFARYGDIVDIRFPSLKYNTHRRFCYIQFVTSTQAAEASAALHGKRVEHNLQLTALISDPNLKRERVGATEEGREIFVKNLPWDVNEVDVRQLFESNGHTNLENVRVPRNMTGRTRGCAFVVFSNKEDTEKALQMDKIAFKNRILTVSPARSNTFKSHSATIVRGRQPSVVSEASSRHAEDARSPQADVTMERKDSSATPNGIPVEGGRLSPRQRTLALLNVPDTVNDARIKALCEPYGQLVKIILKIETGGALIEFEDQKGMGRAALGLDGQELSGSRLRVGQAWEVTRGAGSQHGDKAKSLAPPKVQRPIQGGRGRGGRSKVGSGFGLTAYQNKNPQGRNAGAVAAAGGSKSQDDFRALLAGTSEKTEENETGDAAK